jgi:hypothetical protein
MSEPKAVIKVTTDYRAQSDVLNGFIPGVWMAGDGWVSRVDLFRSFQDYAEDGNLKDLSGWSNRAFYRAIEERGYAASARNGVMGFKGLTKGHGPEVAPSEAVTIKVQTATGSLAGPSLKDLK